LEAGANCIATGCQMCQANLDLYQEQIAKLNWAAMFICRCSISPS
jgi:heterodisulfide reductase subunit B